MPKPTLATQQIALTGTVPAYTAANVAGQSVGNRGRTVIHVKNASASSINVTFITAVTVGNRAVADDIVAVAAGAEKLIGPFDEGAYNTPDGLLEFDFSAVTTVTVAAFTL